MTGIGRWEVFVASLPGTWDSSTALAAARGDATGLLDLTHAPGAATILPAVDTLSKADGRHVGVIVEADRPELYQPVFARLPTGAIVLADPCGTDALRACIAAAVGRGLRPGVLVRAADEAAAAEACGAGFVAAKGHEAGGLVGELTTFVLLQAVRRVTQLPVFAWGGIGFQGAVACRVGGAAGVVLDWQLALMRESPLAPAMRRRIARMDGSETAAVKVCEGAWARVYHRPGFAARDALDRVALDARTTNDALPRARAALRSRLREPLAEEHAWLVGQDAAFAVQFRKAGPSIPRALAALCRHVETALPACTASRALARGAPMAASQNTLYPVMQGAMTRVSDIAPFCDAVEQGGALPMLALALMREADVRALLQSTAAIMGTRSWGVGILGFVERELREEQLRAIEEVRPPYAVIAGGRPDQMKALEAKGIHTYLHVPSPAMLDAFVKEGARRFIFEGFECGGHVGPRSSLVLWESMVDVLAHADLSPEEAAKVHVYFAGGIHDDHSAAMACALAQPIVARGMRFGIEMGTAYLYTHEAIRTGAIVPRFQDVALHAARTVLVETGPGHAIRCAPTEFYDDFEAEKARLKSEGLPAEEIRHRLELHNMGRLRIASKAVDRAPQPAPDGSVVYERVNEDRQRREGMYMIGQVAALHGALSTIPELHARVCDGAVQYLARLAEEPAVVSTRPAEPEPPPPLDIAVVGMACLLPGADNLVTLWDNILRSRNALSEIPPDRFDVNRWFDPRLGARDRINSRIGGFIRDVAFDPLKFGIPPASLPSIEPAQLLTLELVDRALRDAGHDGLKERFAQKERTAVIFGIGGGMGDLGTQYSLRATLPHVLDNIGESLWSQLPEWTEDSFAGLLLNVVAGRVSNKFDLGGPNFTVDAACASSLAAIYLACRELADGTSDMAVTGGVDTVQNPMGYMCFSSARALTTKDRPRVFDEGADGIIISEGLAALVLKRRADAERDGDRIYAVIRAVAGGSDGRSKSMTAPRLEGQIRTLDRAYAQARVSPASVGLFEAHGTGTALGDRTECQSVTEVLRRHGAARATCAIGSIKSMIGHTKCTAGVAGLMKAALALHYRTLAPTMNVTKPNAQGGLQDGPLFVNAEARPWIRGAHLRRAGVSAFGFGGTNFHAVLEEYDGAGHATEQQPVPAMRSAELLALSAATPEALATVVTAVRARVEKFRTQTVPPSVAEVALYCHQEQTAAGACRAALVAGSLDELSARLENLGAVLAKPGTARAEGVYYTATPLAREGAVAFLYPGQGSQYPNMLAGLALDFPELGDALGEADRALAGRLPQPLSRFLYPPSAFSPEEKQQQTAALTATDVAQPALGACSVGLLRLLEACGVRPALHAGHSYGELVALHAAGAMDATALFELSWARGHAMASLAGNGHDLGTMLAVKAGTEAVTQALQGLDDVWIANVNGPQQTVISGTRAGIAAASERLTKHELATVAIPVACAFHSPIVAPAQDAFAPPLRDVAFTAPVAPVFSNTTAAAYDGDAAAIPDTLLRQIVSPVRFVEEIRAMHAAGARMFVEVGPNQVLTRLVPQILGDLPHAAIATNVKDGDETKTLLQALGRLYAEGVNLRLDRLYEGRDLRAADPAGAPPPAASVLLVNGAYLRRPTDPKRACKAKATMNAPAAPNSFPAAPPPAGAAPGVDPAVLVQWQQTMQRFLETQQRVMQAYLGGQPMAGGPLPAAAPQVMHPLPAPSMPVPAPAPVTAPAVTAAAPAPAAAQPQPGLQPAQLEKLLLGLVSDRTGYPPEMLNLDAGLEADLGIDSIKRVEILTAFGKQLPQSGGDLAERLARAKTLREVLKEAQSATPATAPAAAPAARAPATAAEPTHSADTLMKELKALVADRTGYPVDMLNPTLDMEADLGIDSIKRVEILTAFGKQLPKSDGDLAERLAAARTMQAVVEVALSQTGKAPATAAPAAAAPTAAPAPAANGVDRYVVTLKVAPPPKNGHLAIPAGVLIVTDDGRGVAEQFQSRVQALGGHCEIIRIPDRSKSKKGGVAADIASPSAAQKLVQSLREHHKQIAGIVHLAGLSEAPAFDAVTSAEWQQRVDREVKGFFHLLRAASPDLQATPGAWVLAGIDLGGATRDGALPVPAHPWRGGVIGLVKTVVVEWPQAIAKLVDTSDRDPAQAAAQLLAEIAGPQAEPEVYYRNGTRQLPQPVAAPFNTDLPAVELGRDDVVLVIGGARGITAEVARTLAERHRCTIVLAGRSAWPEPEEALTREAQTERDLKQRLFEDLQRRGQKVVPLEVDQRARRILMDREMHATRAAIEAAGARTAYFPVDAQDEPAMQALIQAIRSQFGRLDAIICGAGQIEDKLIADKTPESFSRVLDLKARAAYVLSRVADPASLKALVLFSSIAGWVGNRGQSDYVAANEILNRLALHLAAAWPGRVVAIDWGPWEKRGMVTDLVRQQFESRGVALVPVDSGSQFMVDEIRYGRGPDALVLALGKRAGATA